MHNRPRPGDHVRLIGPSGCVYYGVLGVSGSAGIELYRDLRSKPCVFPAESRVEFDDGERSRGSDANA